ncbi:MAG TPA: DUF2235 domain-containing protein [Longimicrobium sp.]|nr:DUF2235 domain-containing protein [Longimicrobium sp.]
MPANDHPAAERPPVDPAPFQYPSFDAPAPRRNLVICFDGTNNRFGPENTNVVRLVQVLDRDPARQRLYYDPGVGTLPRPDLNVVDELLSRVPGLAFGIGLEENVEEAYGYLMDIWEPGDHVHIFGFSRGAYTARVLAGLLHLLGLLPRGNQNMITYAMELFRAVRGKKGKKYEKYRELCDQFRWTFGRPLFEGDDKRHFRVHFLGVWDTVSSVGWARNPKSYQFTHRNPSISVVRHAVSVDERRAFFRQNQMEQTGSEQDLQELWFPGVHSDVGGGYPNVQGKQLWRVCFEWMLEEARRAGLRVDEERLAMVRGAPIPAEPWNEAMGNSLTPVWRLAEYVPKWRYSFKTGEHHWRMNLGRPRTIKKGSRIHRSTLLRIRTGRYDPPNLTPAFIQKVKALPDVPEWLETDDELD